MSIRPALLRPSSSPGVRTEEGRRPGAQLLSGRIPEDDRLHSGTSSSFISAIKRKKKRRIHPRRRVYSTI
ncbi:hypothetical protein EYF80_061985 [Liparis tanakae]|uniref:Uncharacterized protein n=1 Tax=Liparis tanakae TaxID=230148 RepID=A0A4Z2EGI1_9TELE|nr:hypothetical protein EYF80_061985 [Liparis tanakae]